ncbi:MAG: type II toxin-antitoxin system prevent-host-death family antitoxin [Deltaproteobacteria bacterium]|nr:type II toxin-antitoxin system prevent-host-death family antitoxin [Deltaproteobacteria bacterium]
MPNKMKRREPEIILRKGKPAAVIIDIDDYQEMLEKLEDVEDLQMLAEMRKKPLQFKKLEEFIKEFKPDV